MKSKLEQCVLIEVEPIRVDFSVGQLDLIEVCTIRFD